MPHLNEQQQAVWSDIRKLSNKHTVDLSYILHVLAEVHTMSTEEAEEYHDREGKKLFADCAACLQKAADSAYKAGSLSN
jgi:cytochrome c2